MPSRPVRIAIEGCGHGTLHAIYASVSQASRQKSWKNGPDLVIIGGDFQAVRNANDLTAMSVPSKYREIGDFHEYYSGARKAPYLTLFVGGNHEASNHLFELYYGGWVASNIYYMGAANVLRFGPLRIAALSGIWKGYNYRKPHFERLPYSFDDVKSIYHVRELDVRKLLQIQTQVDIGLSHDWPKGVEWLGNWQQLFRFKPYFEDDAKSGRLGSQAARYVLDWLRPRYWFSAHLHCKFAAIVDFADDVKEPPRPSDRATSLSIRSNQDEIEVDIDGDATPNAANEVDTIVKEGVPEELRAQLPKSFLKAVEPGPSHPKQAELITNKSTQFLALDKCLPRRKFLQLMEVDSSISYKDNSYDDKFVLSYDPEWLAITRVFASELILGDREAQVPRMRDYDADLEQAKAWICENVVNKNLLQIPSNFEPTAPFHDIKRDIKTAERPREYSSPQTSQFCSLVGIENKFDISEEERQYRMQNSGVSEVNYQGPGEHFRREKGGGRGRRGGRSAGGRGRLSAGGHKYTNR